MTANGTILVVGGKGGVGKTSISAILVKLLRRWKLLVIDADPVISLTYTLGEGPGDTIGDYREELIDNPRRARDLHKRPLKEVIHELVTHSSNGYDLLTMGRAEASGCFCGINDLLRHGIQTLCTEYDLSLIDCEAGIEQVNRRAVHRIDRLLLVTDTSRRGFEAVVQVRDLAMKYNDGHPLQVFVAVNRVRDAEEENRVREVAESFELANVTCVPEDPNVLAFNSSGRPLLDLPDDSRSVAALQALTENLNSPATAAGTEKKGVA